MDSKIKGKVNWNKSLVHILKRDETPVVTEQFRLMGLEGLNIEGRKVDIDFGNQSYTQLSKRAGNGWDVNLVYILLDHIFTQLKDLGEDWID